MTTYGVWFTVAPDPTEMKFTVGLMESLTTTGSEAMVS